MDSTVPTLLHYATDLDAGTLTMSFSETVDKMKTAPWLKGAASLLEGSDRRASSFRQLKASDEALEKSNSALRQQIEGLEQELDDPAPSPGPGPKRVTAAVRGARP